MARVLSLSPSAYLSTSIVVQNGDNVPGGQRCAALAVGAAKVPSQAVTICRHCLDEPTDMLFQGTPA